MADEPSLPSRDVALGYVAAATGTPRPGTRADDHPAALHALSRDVHAGEMTALDDADDH